MIVHINGRMPTCTAVRFRCFKSADHIYEIMAAQFGFGPWWCDAHQAQSRNIVITSAAWVPGALLPGAAWGCLDCHVCSPASPRSQPYSRCICAGVSADAAAAACGMAAEHHTPMPRCAA